jgi:hypothetical protein
MALNPQDKSAAGFDLPLPNIGVVPARLARIVEIGKHDTFYGEKDQVFLWYSLPTRLIDAPDSDYHGKQHMLRTAPLRKSSSDKASLMTDHVNVLKPDAQSLDQLLNLAGFVTISHNTVESQGQSRTFANIAQVSGVPEGITVGELDTTPFYFDFDNPDEDVWNKFLWDNIREKIMSAKNYQGSKVEEMVLRLAAMQS